jgi:hypothetical protein
MFVRRTLAALAIGAVLTGGTAATASAGAPTAADRALHLRSEALNTMHGNAVTTRSPDALKALAIRSEGLNSYSRTLQGSTPVAASTSTSTSFAWDDFGIGMAAAFGLVLLMGGVAVAVRTGTRRRVHLPS